MKLTALTYDELREVVSQYVQEQKLSNPNFVPSFDNLVGLLDKIGKITMISQNYVDKLEILDREFLSYGKTVEEWANDLILPQDYDPEGADALAPYDPSYRPVFYSYTLGKKTFPITRRYNDVERAVHNEGEFVEIIASILKSLFDSERVWRYNVKRGILGKIAQLAFQLDYGLTELGDFATNTAYSVGTIFFNGDGTPPYPGVVFREIPATNTKTWDELVSEGYIVVLKSYQKISDITDTTSGEAFVEQLKKDVEIASDNSQGYSFNGNALGAAEGLVLFVKHGVMPTIDVKVLAGAFHEGRVAVPAEIIPIPDFGEGNDDVIAILMDRRGAGLHPTYRAVREQPNGKGDFLNYFLHTENTGYISRNTFVKVYVKE